MSEESKGLGAPPAGHSNKALTQELYDRIKAATGGKVLVFQEGDMCQMIGDDAQIGMGVLAVNQLVSIESCGSVARCITFHVRDLDTNLAILMAADNEVAVCEHKSYLGDVGGVQRVDGYVVESKFNDSEQRVDVDWLVSNGWGWDGMSFTAHRDWGGGMIMRSSVNTWFRHGGEKRVPMNHVRTRGELRRLHEVLGWEVPQ